MAIQDKFNKPNVIYKITKDIDLAGETLTIPEGCTLDFQGGSFSNGTITFNNTKIINSNTTVFYNIEPSGTISVDIILEWFNINKEDSTATIQSIIDFVSTNNKAILIKSNKYNINTINLKGVSIFGEYRSFRSADYTFISNSENYAIIINNGTLENVGILNNIGNGVDASSTDRKLVLNNVYIATHTRKVGSVGLNIGTDNAAIQSIASSYNNVTVRNFDSCFVFNQYCNANSYTDLYALNTTSAKSTYAYYIKCHGSSFREIRSESNFEYSVFATNESYCNSIFNMWSEGIAGINKVTLNGFANFIDNPVNSINIDSVGVNNIVRGMKNAAFGFYDSYETQGNNFIPNSSFLIPVRGSWSAAYFNQITTLDNKNAISYNSSASGTISINYTITDPDIIKSVIGKRVLAMVTGKLLVKGNVSIRLRYKVEGSPYFNQAATGGSFSLESSTVFVTGIIPSNANAIDLYIYGSNLAPSTEALIFTNAIFTYGSKPISSFSPRYLTDQDSVNLVVTTDNRPTKVSIGFQCFDSTLNKPIWVKTISESGVTWVDATGTTV